jgi:hypothetical protein
MTDKWVIDEDNPQGHLVPMTASEQTRYDTDVAAWADTATRQATLDANAAEMRAALAAHLQDTAALADTVEAGSATAAQQRQALVLCLRGTGRLTRLVLELFDQAA